MTNTLEFGSHYADAPGSAEFTKPGDMGAREFPRLIQAGMGVQISNARLANATSRLGALGVISSVGLRQVITDQVRSGMEDAIEIAKTFPIKRYVDELLEYAPGGPMNHRRPPTDTLDPAKSEHPKRLAVICAFIEVMRAKSGHNGLVGINVMWKCALTVLPSIYGAMLAGVDALLCGAGVPMELPDIVKRIRANEDLCYEPLHGTETNARMQITRGESIDLLKEIPDPKLIPILSNYAFPKRIVDVWARQYDGAKPYAFVLENHAAGGHNAPPRNKVEFAEADDIESYFDKVRDMGIPVYVAGAGSTREDFDRWIERGAYGMQVGSRFALSEESGMRDDYKRAVIERNVSGEGVVRTSNRVSSTGYPFKFVPMAGTLSDKQVYDARKRICNKGYLLKSHYQEKPDGSKVEVYICPGMPEKQYLHLGGTLEEMDGRACLCNALLATAGIGDPGEPAIITLGEVGAEITSLVPARAVVEDLLTSEYVEKMEEKLRL